MTVNFIAGGKLENSEKTIDIILKVHDKLDHNKDERTA